MCFESIYNKIQTPDPDLKRLMRFGEEGKILWGVSRRGHNLPIYRTIAKRFRRENRPSFESFVGDIFEGKSDIRTRC